MSNERRKNGQVSFFGSQKNTQSDQMQTGSQRYINEDPEDERDAAVDLPNDIDEMEEGDLNHEIPPEHNVRPHQLDVRSEPAVQVRFEEETKKKKIDFNYENSVILTFLAFLGASVSRLFKNSFVVAIFTAYRRTATWFRDSLLYNLIFNPRTDRLSVNIKKRLRRSATNATIPSTIGRLYSYLMLLKVRAYSVVLLAFTATVLLVHFFIAPSLEIFKPDVYAPITAIILTVASIFLLTQNKSLSSAIKDSLILSTLFFKFLGINHPSFNDTEEQHFHVSGALLIGFLLGALNLFFPAHSIVLFILTLIYTLVVVKHPEAGVISLILIAPIMNNVALVYICITIALSYLFKILTGKRTPTFEFSDIFPALFLLLTLLSEFFTYGSIGDPLLSSSFILVYFLCICALRVKSWFERAVNAIILGACVFSAYSVLVTFLAKGLELNVDFISNTDIGNAKASAFDSVSVLAIILICSIFYMLSAAFTTKSKSNRFGMIFFIAASMLFIFREASITVKFAFLIALMIFLVLRSGKFFIGIILTVAILPLLPLFNDGIYNGIVQLVESELFRLDIWISLIPMLIAFGFIGIGNSPSAFSEIYATFYVGNNTTLGHSHSLILQIAISLGFVGIMLFIMIIFFIMQGAFSYGRNCSDKTAKSRLFCYAGMCSVCALSLSGLTENIWYNPRIALIFWLFCGLTVCARRSANDLSASAEILLELEENYNG